jgi:hypothetical protein
MWGVDLAHVVVLKGINERMNVCLLFMMHACVRALCVRTEEIRFVPLAEEKAYNVTELFDMYTREVNARDHAGTCQ